MKLYIGLMSGTSMDGIDAVLMDVTRHTLIGALTHPYSDDARNALMMLLSRPLMTAGELSQLNTLLGREFAQAVHQLLATVDVTTQDIIAIGSHGQTISHDANASIPYTVQLGCPHTIAELTGLTVVADFRVRDLILGGRGAPFAPLYHQALFAHLDASLAIVNIGGIANVTYLSSNGAVSGYDTGPGNCLMDAWAQKHLQLPYDANGEWAATGRVCDALLTALLDDAYFKLPAPKSIGKEYFSLDWVTQHLNALQCSKQDLQATLLALTATSIAKAIHTRSLNLKRVLICGGGAHNQALFQALQLQLPQLDIASTQSVQVNPDFLEAMMFAWLADKTINHIPIDLSLITGAKKAAILGAIIPGHIDKRNSIGF